MIYAKKAIAMINDENPRSMYRYCPIVPLESYNAIKDIKIDIKIRR